MPGARCQVPGARWPGARCQVPCQVPPHARSLPTDCAEPPMAVLFAPSPRGSARAPDPTACTTPGEGAPRARAASPRSFHPSHYYHITVPSTRLELDPALCGAALERGAMPMAGWRMKSAGPRPGDSHGLVNG